METSLPFGSENLWRKSGFKFPETARLYSQREYAAPIPRKTWLRKSCLKGRWRNSIQSRTRLSSSTEAAMLTRKLNQPSNGKDFSPFPCFLFPRQTYARLKLDLERDKGSAAVQMAKIVRSIAIMGSHGCYCYEGFNPAYLQLEPAKRASQLVWLGLGSSFGSVQLAPIRTEFKLARLASLNGAS